MIFVSSWPARPTNGSPWTSSSAPGASPTNISAARGLPTPNTTWRRPSPPSLHRVQSGPMYARRSSSEPPAAAIAARSPQRVDTRAARPPRAGSGRSESAAIEGRPGVRPDAPHRIADYAGDTELREEREVVCQIGSHRHRAAVVPLGTLRASPGEPASSDLSRRSSRSSTAAATSALGSSGNGSTSGFRRASPRSVGTSKPEPDSETSLATIEIDLLRLKLLQARGTGSPVSAANPMSTGPTILPAACAELPQDVRGPLERRS